MRSATIRATTDASAFSTSYEEFIAEIEHNLARAVEFMKTLVRRLRQMNDMMESSWSTKARVPRHDPRLAAEIWPDLTTLAAKRASFLRHDLVIRLSGSARPGGKAGISVVD